MNEHYRPIWRPYTQEAVQSAPLRISRAEGSYVFSENGQAIFDGISSWWVITHGHRQPQIMEAIRQQTERLDQVLFANFTHDAAEELSCELLRLVPRHLRRVFFSDNGSTAVEVALKMAIQACVQRGLPKKTRFLSFSNSYHGDTFGAMSVSGRGVFTRPFRAHLFNVHLAKQPIDPQAPVADWVVGYLQMLEENRDEIAGVIIEPILQAAGGMIVWPLEAIRIIGEHCQKSGIFLIFDEVMTGFGRTGSLFAMDQLGLAPDLLCLSKGLTGGALPLALTLASEEIYASFYLDKKELMFLHGHSFTGNPIASAAALANLRLCASPALREKWLEIENQHRLQLAVLAAAVPIKNPRLCGTMAAFEIGESVNRYGSSMAEEITRIALQKGLFIRPLGNTVYLLPPYSSTPADLTFAWQILQETLQQINASEGDRPGARDLCRRS